MRCQEAKKRIAAYLDGELDLDLEQQLNMHLTSCDSCGTYFESACETDNMLKEALIHLEPPKDFTQQLMLRLEEAAEQGTIGSDLVERAESTGGRRWISVINRRWLKTGVAASIAAMLLFGGFGVSGSASGDDSLAKRVFLISRDGISGIRRVVDNVINLAQNEINPKPEKPEAPVKPQQKEENKASEEPPVVEEAPAPASETAPGEENLQNSGEQVEVALKEEESQKENTDQETPSEGATMAAPLASMTAVVSPVIFNADTDNVRPVWVDRDSIYYLSEKRAPREGTFVIWETNMKGSSRRMVSSPGYCLTLEHGGGVWSPYYKNYAFVTGNNGYWQTAYSSLKGQMRMAVDVDAKAARPAEGVLWEYDPAPSSKGEIAFLTKRFGNVDLMAADKDGRVRTIAKTKEIEGNPVWSEDGSKIAFSRSSGGSSGKCQVIIADRNGKYAKAVTPALSKVDMVPAWSSDGKQLAVNVKGAGDKNGLWIVNSDGSNWRKVSNKGGGKIVSWSPDDKTIAFTGKDGRLYAWDVTAGADDTRSVINIEPNDQNGVVEYISWSPDSKQLLLQWNGEQTRTRAVWRAEILKF